MIGLDYSVAVSISSGPSKVAEINPNVMAMFSHEVAGFTDDYRIYKNSTDVIKDFGSDSMTAKLAQTVFGQRLNINRGGGYLVIIRLINTTSGTAPKIDSDIASKIAAFKAVDDGVLKLTVNGSERESIFLDFTKVETVADITKVINAKAVGYTAKTVGDKIVFQTKIVGASVTFTMSTATSTGTDLSGAAFLDSSTATSTAGTDPTGETLQDAMTRLDGSVAFHGIMTTKLMPTAEKIAFAEYVQPLRHLFFANTEGMQDAEEFGKVVVEKSLYKTRTFGMLESNFDTKKLNAGAMSVLFSADTNGVNTALTLENKSVTGVVGNDRVGDTELSKLHSWGVDVYVKRTEVMSTLLTSNANKYIDTAYLENVLSMKLEIDTFNAFRVDTKIAQSAAGRETLRKTVETTLSKLVRANFLTTGEEWDGEVPFGDEDEFKESIRLKGFYVMIVPAVTQADREKREAVIYFAVKGSGAFHKAKIIGQIQE